MKKIWILVVMALFFVPFLVSAANLEATLLRSEPLPAQPGQYVTVHVELSNRGNEPARNAVLEIQDQFPFSVVNQNQAVRSVGPLPSQQSYVASFRLRVSSDAVTGTNFLRVRYTDDERRNVWVERDIPITVRPTRASLALSHVQTSPDAVLPGEDVQVSLRLHNTADVTLRNIATELQLSSASSSQPFIPQGSSAKQSLVRLHPNEVKEVDFNLKTFPQAQPGFYLLPVHLSFFDEEGVEQTQSEYIGIVVDAAPELAVFVDDSSIRDSSGTMTLKFVNKGIHELRFLEVSVLENEAHTIRSQSRIYLGDLMSDDFRTQTFSLDIHDANESLQLQVSYRDENNNRFEQTLIQPIVFDRSPQEARSPVGIIVVLIILAGIAIWWWRKKKK